MPLATAQHLGGVSGAAALTAAIAGFEVGPRVGLALHGAEMLSRGWHSGPVFGTHTAAMAAGKLRGFRPVCSRTRWAWRVPSRPG